MSRTYAIPDIHGRLDLLDQAIDAISSASKGQRATVVTLGDYVDRGPHTRQVIERLMGWQSTTLDLVHLKGNHEAMMEAVCRRQADLDWWLRNGGGATLASYGQPAHRPDLSGISPDHLQWLSNLPSMYVDQHRVFVHAAVDPKVPLDQQSEEMLLWARYPDGTDIGHGRRHVVHGHHADKDAPIVKKNKTNLDGLAWSTGRLIVGVFDDDKPGGPSGFLEIVGSKVEQ